MSRQYENPRTIYLLTQATQSIRSRLEMKLRPMKLTGIQYTIMSILNARPGTTSADLSRRFYVSPQTMNEIIGNMTKAGIIQRSEDANNKRRLQMSLTKSGKALLKECDRVAEQIEAETFGGLSDLEFRQLRKSLLRLMTEVRSLEPAAS